MKTSTTARILPGAATLVTQRPANTSTSVVAGPRLVVADRGELVCTLNVQSRLSANDFAPVLSRSHDNGQTWSEQGPLWPHLRKRHSIFGSISRSGPGRLLFFGTRTPIDEAGESFWSDATQGLKANELCWSSSTDEGRTWAEPAVIPMPESGAAEAPGAMAQTRRGRLLCCYAPYPTFERTPVRRNCVRLMFSDDGGKSWSHRDMLRFDEGDGGAESWVVQLADGRLVGASWHYHVATGADYPNAYAVSEDEGQTWSATRPAPFRGQSIALTPMPDGRLLVVYNHRRSEPVGVRMAIARLNAAAALEVEADAPIWNAPVSPGASADHQAWKHFSFGEPAAALTSERGAVVVFWRLEDGIGSIGRVSVALEP